MLAQSCCFHAFSACSWYTHSFQSLLVQAILTKTMLVKVL